MIIQASGSVFLAQGISSFTQKLLKYFRAAMLRFEDIQVTIQTGYLFLENGKYFSQWKVRNKQNF